MAHSEEGNGGWKSTKGLVGASFPRPECKSKEIVTEGRENYGWEGADEVLVCEESGEKKNWCSVFGKEHGFHMLHLKRGNREK